jgi:hypothetical protein
MSRNGRRNYVENSIKPKLEKIGFRILKKHHILEKSNLSSFKKLGLKSKNIKIKIK